MLMMLSVAVLDLISVLLLSKCLFDNDKQTFVVCRGMTGLGFGLYKDISFF